MDAEMSGVESIKTGLTEKKSLTEKTSIEELSAILRQNGIVGAGGAGFPTYAKLDKRADTIIMNCAECEPLLKLHRQLLEQEAFEIVKTFHLIAKCVGAKEAVIGIKKAYKKTIEALKGCIGEYPEIRLGLLDEVYPAGDEVVLIYEVTGKVVPPGGLPIESGVAVFNVETVYNIYKAAALGSPVEDKLVSIVGEVENPVTVRVPLGCTIEEAVSQAGKITVKNPVFFIGGPMMGFEGSTAAGNQDYQCNTGFAGRTFADSKEKKKIFHRFKTCGGSLLSMYDVYRSLSETLAGASDRAT